MSVKRNLSSSNITSKSISNRVGGKGVGSKTLSTTHIDWFRNPSWLDLPSVSETDQKFVGLYRVESYNTCTISALNDYVVDWGDGTITYSNDSVNVTSDGSIICQHTFDYNNPLLDGTNAPILFDDINKTIIRSGHGYRSGDRVNFYDITGNVDIDPWILYFVVNPTYDTFQISDTLSGGAVQFSGDGSAVLLPYKQSIVTLTPQPASTLTRLSLHQSYTGGTTGWLDIITGSSYFTDFIDPSSGLYRSPLQISSLYGNYGEYSEHNRLLLSCKIYDFGNSTNISYMFHNCSNIRSIQLPNTQNVVDMSYTFSGCTSLQSVPLFNTQNVTNMGDMFSGCTSLQSVPLFNTQNVTNMSYTFNNCSSLQSIPLLNTQSVTTMYLQFFGCSSLKSVSLPNTQSVTNTSNMFTQCSSLQSLSLPTMYTSFSVSNCNLSVTGLNNLYTSLPSVTGSQTVTVSGNPGISGDSPSIATSKGWIVSGS